MTKQVQHTPAPWGLNIHKDGGNWTYKIVQKEPELPGAPHGHQIAELNKHLRQVEENANLIAAAPELLAALEDTLDMAERYYASLEDDSPEQDAYMTQVIEPARAAINKAKGE